jgi:hypothetical protein
VHELENDCFDPAPIHQKFIIGSIQKRSNPSNPSKLALDPSNPGLLKSMQDPVQEAFLRLKKLRLDDNQEYL